MSDRPHAHLPAKQLDGRSVDQIVEIFDEMADGFNAKSPAEADRHFTSDAIVVTPDGRRVEGLDALLRYHEHRFAGPASRWQTAYRVLTTTMIDGLTAIVHTAQDTTTSDGAFRNHGTFVLVKRERSWWIAAAHSTNVEAQRSLSDDGTEAPSS